MGKPRPRSQRKSAPTAQQFKAVNDVLHKLHRGTSIKLPQGMTPETFYNLTGLEALRYAVKLACDDEFWGKVPDSFLVRPWSGEAPVRYHKTRLRRELNDIVEPFIAEP